MISTSGLLQLAQLTLQLAQALLASQLQRFQTALVCQQRAQIRPGITRRPLKPGQIQPKPCQLLLAQSEQLAQVNQLQLQTLAGSLLLFTAQTRLFHRPLAAGHPLLSGLQPLGQRFPLLLQLGKARLIEFQLLTGAGQPLCLLGLFLIEPDQLFAKLAQPLQPLLPLALLQAPGFAQLLPFLLLLAQSSLRQLLGTGVLRAPGIGCDKLLSQLRQPRGNALQLGMQPLTLPQQRHGAERRALPQICPVGTEPVARTGQQ